MQIVSQWRHRRRPHHHRHRLVAAIYNEEQAPTNLQQDCHNVYRSQEAKDKKWRSLISQDFLTFYRRGVLLRAFTSLIIKERSSQEDGWCEAWWLGVEILGPLEPLWPSGFSWTVPHMCMYIRARGRKETCWSFDQSPLNCSPILRTPRVHMPATSRLEKDEWVFVDTCSESSWEMLLS